MTQTATASVSPLRVAKNRWDETTNMTAAYKICLGIRTRRAKAQYGQPGELQAWRDVAECEAQLVAAEAMEVLAWQEVANLEARGRDRRGR